MPVASKERHELAWAMPNCDGRRGVNELGRWGARKGGPAAEVVVEVAEWLAVAGEVAGVRGGARGQEACRWPRLPQRLQWRSAGLAVLADDVACNAAMTALLSVPPKHISWISLSTTPQNVAGW